MFIDITVTDDFVDMYYCIAYRFVTLGIYRALTNFWICLPQIHYVIVMNKKIKLLFIVQSHTPLKKAHSF